MFGLKVARDRSRHLLWVTQTAYIESSRAVSRFSSKLAKSAPFPVAHNENNGEDNELATARHYQEVGGCLLWLAGCSRPDICFAASYLTRYMSSPSEYHWQLALRIVSYLVHTRTLGVILGRLATGGSSPIAMRVVYPDDLPRGTSATLWIPYQLVFATPSYYGILEHGGGIHRRRRSYKGCYLGPKPHRRARIQVDRPDYSLRRQPVRQSSLCQSLYSFTLQTHRYQASHHL